jgi:GAF domain-containing protein
MEKKMRYQQVFEKCHAVLDGENDSIAAMATIASLLAQGFSHFYWVGFYRMLDGELVIGPYQGTLGCLRIGLNRGVCGAAASEVKTMIVDNVHDFPGHIACDPRSQSEIVVPVMDVAGNVVAVLDVDSTEESSFDGVDRDGLEKIVGLLESTTVVV